MQITDPAGLIAVILAVICFYGMTYVVIALSTGWRFGYWIASATFGALMVLMSIFWIVNPVGPRGLDAAWEPLEASRDRIAQAALEDKRFSTPSRYPDSPWEVSSSADQKDAFASAITTCISTKPDKLAAELKKACEAAQALMPQPDDIPVIDGSAVAISPEARVVRFTTDKGALLGQATVVPMTHDPRVVKDAKKGRAMGPSFKLLAVYDKGSVRVPPFASLFIFGLYFAFHLWGLNRAEKRKLSPIAA